MNKLKTYLTKITKPATTGSLVKQLIHVVAVLINILIISTLINRASAQVIINDAEFYVAPGAVVQINSDFNAVQNSTNQPTLYLSDSLIITGDLELDSGIVLSGDGWIVLKGSETQMINSNSVDIQKLKINNSNGAGLQNELQIPDSLHFITGVLSINGYNLTIGTFSSDSGVIIGSSDVGYIQTSDTGELRRYVSGGTFFPVGNSSYNPAMIYLNNTDSIGVRVEDEVYENYFPASGKQTANALNRAWFVSKDSSSNTMEMIVYWGQTDELNSFDRTNCILNYYNDSAGLWPVSGSFSSAVSTGSLYSQSNNNFHSFNTYFGVGSENSPLPVELLNFEVKWITTGEQAQLNWSTASESNCDFFEIQRSTDAGQWRIVGRKQGQGNSSAIVHYQYVDQLPGDSKSGIYYYRLKQFDFNGDFSYSPIRMLHWESDNKNLISVFPNPASNEINIRLSEQNVIYNARITDGAGKLIQQKTIKEFATFNVNELSRGIYYLQMESDAGELKVFKIMVVH
ncbi:MAG: T9SS type A sorting domain-containing protein [Bacteroidetes bacterium]|nr:T9SS type A sorting domain-containing protein [Bacteroidota bacterium]